MPVDEDFNLDNPDGITTEDIQKMNEEANELEEVAKKAEESGKKIEDAKSKMEGLNFAQLNIIEQTVGAGGEAAESQMSKEEMMDLMIDVLKEMETAKNERKENKKKIDKEVVDRKAAIQKVKKAEGEINEIHGAINGMRSNPFGFGKSKVMGLIGKAGVWGVVAQFAIDLSQQVFDEVLTEVKKQFGPGGVWDRRKLVLDVLNEYNSIEYLTKVKSGQVIFTADAGQDLRQGAPRGSFNTRDLRDGHLRFIQLHAGV